jgi:hypothetical protein
MQIGESIPNPAAATAPRISPRTRAVSARARLGACANTSIHAGFRGVARSAEKSNDVGNTPLTTPPKRRMEQALSDRFNRDARAPALSSRRSKIGGR